MADTPASILILTGATAVGKTDWAIEYALTHNCEIISADSMQVYRHMDIGTAKPDSEQRARVKHHLIDIINPDQNFSVHNFLTVCQTQAQQIINQGKQPLLVGGTGLYINAFIRAFNMPVIAKDETLRKLLKEKAQHAGTAVLYEDLQRIDPQSCQKIMPNDLYRIIRALEVYQLTGIPLSNYHQKEKQYRTDVAIWLLQRDRETIYRRIEARVDLMIKAGLLDEVRELLQKGYDPRLPALQALGYKETINYLNGRISQETCIEEIKKKSRHFAKRQLTWFRSFPIAKVINF